MTALPPIRNKLHGKVAIVTGEATVQHFINHDALAVVIADVQDEKGQSVAASICPNRCIYIHCDVADENQVKSLVETTVTMYGRLDVMFNNAGVISRRSQTVLDLDMSELDKVFSVNARGMVACVKHAARVMKEVGAKGSIICTASTLATRGFDACRNYVMSKSAVLGLVRSASLQLASDGILVNSVSPGSMATPMTCAGMGAEREKADELLEQLSRLKGVLKEKHVADAVSFLASDESEFVTGLDLVVDGGFIVRR